MNFLRRPQIGEWFEDLGESHPPPGWTRWIIRGGPRWSEAVYKRDAGTAVGVRLGRDAGLVWSCHRPSGWGWVQLAGFGYVDLVRCRRARPAGWRVPLGGRFPLTSVGA